MSNDDEALSRGVASTVLHVHRQLVNMWPKAVGDTTAASLALISTLHSNSELADLILHSAMFKAVMPKMAALKPNSDEVVTMLAVASRRRHPGATQRCNEPLISERIDRVQKALSSTLKEPLPSEIWKNNTAKLVCILCFHLSDSPLHALNSIFGSVVRSDTRRVDDLHEEQCSDPLDTLALCSIVDCVCGVLVA